MKCPLPARAPKPTKPGPGRPPGVKNRRRATVQDVGLVLKTGEAHSRPSHHKKGTKPRRVTGRAAAFPDQERSSEAWMRAMARSTSSRFLACCIHAGRRAITVIFRAWSCQGIPSRSGACTNRLIRSRCSRL